MTAVRPHDEYVEVFPVIETETGRRVWLADWHTPEWSVIMHDIATKEEALAEAAEYGCLVICQDGGSYLL